MPAVNSTVTRCTGRTTVNLFVKNSDTSCPREAISAISSALTTPLDVFGIGLLFSLGCDPGRDQVMILTLRATPDLKYNGTQAASAPTDCSKLFRIIVLLVHHVHLVEDLLRLWQPLAVRYFFLAYFFRSSASSVRSASAFPQN